MRKDKVYFAAGGGRLKVGTTVRGVPDRIAAINAHLLDRIELIGFIDGGRPLERAIQRYLVCWRLHGEWFLDCQETQKIVINLLKAGPRAIDFVGDVYQNPRQTQPHIPAHNPRAMGIVARLMWGPDAAAKLAALGDVSESDATDWLEDSSLAPRTTRKAFSYDFMEWLNQDDGPDHFEWFLDQEIENGNGHLYGKLWLREKRRNRTEARRAA